jgi:hypothetical protein
VQRTAAIVATGGMEALAQNVASLRRRNTSGVGGESGSARRVRETTRLDP